MGKVLKKIGTALTFIGIAAAAVVTAGIALPTIALTRAIQVGTVLGGTLSTIGGSLAKGPQLQDSGAEARGAAFFDPNATGFFVFGETASPAVLVFEQNHGENKELISAVFAHHNLALTGMIL